MEENSRKPFETGFFGGFSWKHAGDRSSAAASTSLCDTGNSSSYFFCDQESSILSQFGWNLAEGSSHHLDDSDFPALDQIDFGEVSDLAGSRELPENCSLTYIPPIPAESSAKSVDVSTPNLSVSSTSSDEQPEKPPAVDRKQHDKPINKGRKKGPQQSLQPRFAFMTKSEVDHLEDGYQWRKYGQKAIKNSSFPRSYYRCSNSKCHVKKRVERSSEDPSIVMTTYEGHHCHHTTGFPRGSTSSRQLVSCADRLTKAQFLAPVVLFRPVGPFGNGQPQKFSSDAVRASPMPEQGSQFMTNEGLLGDIVPDAMRSG